MGDERAPERIWADARIGDGGFWACDADEYDQGDSSAYVRADLYDALAKERDQALVKCDSLNEKLGAWMARAGKAEARWNEALLNNGEMSDG